jgi:hypothetical protein
MKAIIARRTLDDNRDGSVTHRHRGVAPDREAARRTRWMRDGSPAGFRAPAQEVSQMFRRFAVAATSAALLISVAASTVAAGGPPSLAFYVDDVRYRTVGTPTDFSGTGAPASSFDAIYALGNGLINVAEAKPGDRDFNGGRWMVLPLTWAAGVTPVQLTSAEQVHAYAGLGMLTIAAVPVKQFECPVIPVGGD